MAKVSSLSRKLVGTLKLGSFITLSDKPNSIVYQLVGKRIDFLFGCEYVSSVYLHNDILPQDEAYPVVSPETVVYEVTSVMQDSDLPY